MIPPLLQPNSPPAALALAAWRTTNWSAEPAHIRAPLQIYDLRRLTPRPADTIARHTGDGASKRDWPPQALRHDRAVHRTSSLGQALVTTSAAGCPSASSCTAAGVAGALERTRTPPLTITGLQEAVVASGKGGDATLPAPLFPGRLESPRHPKARRRSARRPPQFSLADTGWNVWLSGRRYQPPRRLHRAMLAAGGTAAPPKMRWPHRRTP